MGQTRAIRMGRIANRHGRETIMNTLINNSLKALACGAAAVAITAVFSLSFVQSTAVVRSDGSTATSAWTAKLSTQPGHTWFGQPEPAVLVD
jgi:hypothetical protein